VSTPAEEPAPVALPGRVLFAAPVLLVLTALVQLVLAKAGPLTPWKGGGFGLFSTVDRLETRTLFAWLETPDGDEPLAVGGHEHEVQNALAFPVDRHLRGLAESLAAGQTEGTAVRVEVWKRTFDPATGECRRVLAGKLTVPLAR
jgi:hypothetical protein